MNVLVMLENAACRKTKSKVILAVNFQTEHEMLDQRFHRKNMAPIRSVDLAISTSKQYKEVNFIQGIENDNFPPHCHFLSQEGI